jgi:hypothetical protein
VNSRRLLSWLLFVAFIVLLIKSPGLRTALWIIFGLLLVLPTILTLFAPSILKNFGRRMGGASSGGFGGFGGQPFGGGQASQNQGPQTPPPNNGGQSGSGRVTITRVAPDPSAKPANKRPPASNIEDAQFEEI